MRKAKILAQILMLSLLIMGTGYAYWNDALAISNTVSTGELNVVFNDHDSFTSGRDALDYPAYVFSDTNDQKGSFASIVTDNGKVFKAKIGNLYPGAWGRIQTRIDNVGTLPAVVDSVQVTFKGKTGFSNLTEAEQKLVDTLVFVAGYEKFNSNGTNTDGTDKWNWTHGGDLDSDTTGLEVTLNEMLKDVRLEPGQYIKLDIPDDNRKDAYASIGLPFDLDDNCLFFKFPGEADNNSELEKQTISIDIKINWKQHNASF